MPPSTSPPLPVLLSHLFFNFIPSIIFGFLSLALSEAAHLTNALALHFHHPTRPPSPPPSRPLTPPHTPASASVRTANLAARRTLVFDSILADSSTTTNYPSSICDSTPSHSTSSRILQPNPDFLSSPLHLDDSSDMDHSTAAVSSSSHPSASKNLRILIPEPVLRAPVAKTRNNTDRFPPLFLPQPPSSPQTDVCSSPEGNMANVNSNTCSNISDYDVVVALREGVQGVRDGCDSMDMVVTVPTIAMNNFQDVQEKAVKRVTLVTPPVTTPTQARNWAPGTSPRHLQSTNSTRGVSESLLFRQASIDVTGLNAQSLHDRPRSSPGSAVRAIGTRFGIATSRLSQAVSARGKTSPGPATRSASAMDNRFDDWPEYTPSRQEDLSALGRRHVSDLSFGVKDRKKDMLPVELLNEEGMDRKRCGNVDMEDRMVGKGWKKRLGIAAGVRELSDTRATVRSILRRRRKTLLSGSGDNTVRRMESHYGSEMSVRKAFNHERDYKFECELGLDTVFSLLTRICGDCGFVVTVRKCNHKMKVEVPWEGEGVPLLVSISLTRVAQGRNTCVTLSRSKDDESGGPGKEIEAASVLLQKRLSSHVEYIEDSFASLYFDGSINEMREEHSM